MGREVRRETPRVGKNFQMNVVWYQGHGFQKAESSAGRYKAIVGFLENEDRLVQLGNLQLRASILEACSAAGTLRRPTR